MFPARSPRLIWGGWLGSTAERFVAACWAACAIAAKGKMVIRIRNRIRFIVVPSEKLDLNDAKRFQNDC